MKKARVIVRVVLVILCLAAVVFSYNFVAYATAPTYDVSEEYKGGKYYDNIRAVELSGDGARDTLAIALSQLGYHEGSDMSGLDGLSTDGGRDFVEYNVLYGKLDNQQGNGLSYGYYWCASFVNWCLRQAEVPLSASAGQEVSCHRWLSACKKAGIYNEKHDYAPKSADMIFFKDTDSQVSSTHIGLVLYVRDDRVYTIEGNTGGKTELSTNGNYVALRSYPLDSEYIVGYATPKYNKVEGIGELDHSGIVRSAGQYISVGEMIIYSDSSRSKQIGKIDIYTVFDVESVDGSFLYLADGGCAMAILARQITADNDICSVSYVNDDGVKIYPNQYVQGGESLCITSDVPEKAGSVFAGWRTVAQNELIQSGEYITPEENLELVAVFINELETESESPDTTVEETSEAITEPDTESQSPELTEELTEQITNESTEEETSAAPEPTSPTRVGCSGALGVGCGAVGISLSVIFAFVRRKRDN